MAPDLTYECALPAARILKPLRSRLYDLNGIYLDQGPHLGGFVSGGLPRSIKILAIEEGLFRSSVAEFLLPDRECV